MALRIRGIFEHTVDDKGRVSLPLRFREALQLGEGDRVIIANFATKTSRCLDVYTEAVWERLEESMSARPQFGQVVMHFLNYYMATAQECSIDKQGRILLTQQLRDYAGLKRDIIFTSALNKFRIWDREQWSREFATSERVFIEHPEILDGLRL